MSYQVRGATVKLNWCPYPVQTALILVGLELCTAGIMFYLISVGSSARVWTVLAGSLTVIGFLCASIGGLFCVISVQKARSLRRGIFSARSFRIDTDIETATSQATTDLV